MTGAPHPEIDEIPSAVQLIRIGRGDIELLRKITARLSWISRQPYPKKVLRRLDKLG